MTHVTDTHFDSDRAEALDERLITAAIGTLEMYSIHLGRTLGLYEALANPTTVDGLALATGIDPRYAREWLEQQAVAGLICADDSDDWNRRVYWLSDEQTALFVTATHPSHVSPLADMVAGVGNVLGDVAASYRSGGGVPYRDYGATFRNGQAGVNRPAFTHDLVEGWIWGSVPDVARRLQTGGRIADVGCGAGWSTIALAQGFPAADVIGIDSDKASIEDARRNSTGAGVRAVFKDVDGARLVEDGRYDLIVLLEALHDMARPDVILSQVRAALKPDGAVLVADEKVAEKFHAPGVEMERMMYGWSVVHCLPASMAEPDSAALGTVLRAGLVRQMALAAGFSEPETPDIDAGFFDLYVLRP